MPSFSAIRDKDEKKADDSPSEESDDEELTMPSTVYRASRWKGRMTTPRYGRR